jgi:hypothetical protein
MRNLIITLLLVLTTSIILLISTQKSVLAGNLGCSDISGCEGAASCGGRGISTGLCVIDCEDGSEIWCNFKELE